MNKIVYITVSILFTQFTFNFVNAQQQVLISTSQKQCEWDKTVKGDGDCVEFEKEYSISIDKTKDRIRIYNPEKTTIYKIISLDKKEAGFVYKVIQANGVGKTITHNPVNDWIKVRDKQLTESSIIQYYFIK